MMRTSANVSLLILPVNLKGTECDQATAVPSPKPISAPSSAEKDIGLCPVTSAGADGCAATSPTASEVIVTSKNKCVSCLNLSNLFVHFNRHKHPRSTHSTRHFFLDPTADVTVKNDSTAHYYNALHSFGFQNGSTWTPRICGTHRSLIMKRRAAASATSHC